MKNHHQQAKGSYLYGILSSAIASFLLSLICVFSIIDISSSLTDFFGLFFLWALIAQFISLLGVMVIGIPVVLALSEFNKTNNLYAAFAGGLIVFFIIFGFGNPFNNWFSLVYVVYGFVCGYAFMYGFKKGHGNEYPHHRS